MFTLSDIRNIAVQIEENGEQTYRRAAERSVDPERKRLFTCRPPDLDTFTWRRVQAITF